MRRCLLFLIFVVGCGGSVQHTHSEHAQTKTGATGGDLASIPAPVDDRLDPDVEPQRYRVRLVIDPKKEAYSGVVEIDIKLAKATQRIWLHSENHGIQKAVVTINDKSVDGIRLERGQPDWLSLSAPEKFPKGKATLRLEFTGVMNHKLVGMYRVKHDKHWYVYTQFEPLDARKAFPCFDEPRFKTPYEMTYVTPGDIKAFSNAPIKDSKTLENGQIERRFKATPPLPSYLVATAIGPLDVAEKPSANLKRKDGSILPIRILTVKGRAKDAEYALEEAGRVVAIQEEYFGIRYPYAKLDLVAVPDFGAGAMENAGLITYRDRMLLFDKKTGTEDELRGYIGIHAHEVAHMWFGDLVTMAWWDDLWLNEAFATWYARKVSDVYRPSWKTEFRLISGRRWVMDQDSSTASRRMREPITERGDIKNAFDGITYTKGAAVLDMFERYVGEVPFRDGIRLYMKRHAWGSATFDNLLDAIEETSGKGGLKAAMTTFIDQAGVPHLTVEPQSCVDGNTPVKVSQKRWQPLGDQQLKPGHWHVPFCARSVGDEAKTCTLITQKEQVMTLPGCGQVILPNAGAGGYLIWSMPKAGMDAITQKIGTLTEYEQVNLMANLGKLYQSGDVDPDVLVALAPELLKVKSDRIRQAALSLIGQLGELVIDSDRPAWNRYRDSMVGDLLKEVGWGGKEKESRERWALRRSVIRIAGIQGHRPNVIKAARKMADDFLAKKPVTRELIRTVLRIDADHSDKARFESYRAALLGETDPGRRSPLVSGIGSFRFKGFADASFKLAQNKKLRVNERGRFIWAPVRNYRIRDEAWTWLKNHLDVARGVMARGGARYLPYFPVGACRAGIKDEIQTVFSPLIKGKDKVAGIDRHIKNAQNRLAHCIAKRKRYGDAIKAVLKPFQPTR